MRAGTDMRVGILILGLAGVLSLAGAMGAAVTIDRIAVIVGKHVVKASDIDRDLRLTEFLNREPLDLSAPARRKAAERLIDQQIIRTELATGGYGRATDANAEALLGQIQKDRFGNTAPRLHAELSRYSVTEDELRRQLLWQLTVLRFIQQRFQGAGSVTDEAERTYYDQHLADLKKQNPKDSTFDALEPQIRTLLEGEAVNHDFEDWLSRARQRTQIEYREGAFQ
jgi:hypothetical protein